MIFSITISAYSDNSKIKVSRKITRRTIGHHMTGVLDNHFDIPQH